MRQSLRGPEKPREWRVVEQFSETRDAKRGNEDGYLMTDHCIAVLDGVSSGDSPERIDGLTPGQFAVKVGLEALRKNPNLDPKGVALLLTQRLREALTGRGISGIPSFVFVAFFPKYNQIVRVGDCSYLIDGKGRNPGIAVDYAHAIVRKRALTRRIKAGATIGELVADDPTRDPKGKWRAWQDHYSNNPVAKDFGYGVIDGRAVPEEFIDYIVVPKEARSLVLASDGYPPAGAARDA